MDETVTKQKKTNPALYGVRWNHVPESEIVLEKRRKGMA